ncbi:hypothetical protein [Streptomyces sp. NPDC099088]|uniref:hypothetical protein n=1 Tax=Streptomyces sp. NPDC099088 TaxID=3366101 RepID=UPI003804C260
MSQSPDRTFVSKLLGDKSLAHKLVGDKALADKLLTLLGSDDAPADKDLGPIMLQVVPYGGSFSMTSPAYDDIVRRARADKDLAGIENVIFEGFRPYQEAETARRRGKPTRSEGYTDDPTSPTDSVFVFTERNCTGKHAQFGPGRYDIDVLRQDIGNDAMSSLAIPKGWGVTLYTAAGFSGDSTTIAPRRDGVGGDRCNLTDGFKRDVSSLVITGISDDASRQHQVTPTYHGSATGYTKAEGQSTY